MRRITDSQVELIDRISKESQGRRLNAGILEDDIHVTEALHALSTLQYPHVHLVFGGEPSLAKAYWLIKRITFAMDLRVVLGDDHGLSRKELDEHLRTFHKLVRAVMTGLNFVADKKGSYGSPSSITMSWLYQSRYSPTRTPSVCFGSLSTHHAFPLSAIQWATWTIGSTAKKVRPRTRIAWRSKRP
ncbi:hypothetical protein [Caballeronia sp. SBC2]|uniref:hypothetical protein n=1 Tax=Caballeronia sp. SBC2 TaxID=2705547 RepID=UPI0013E1910F|nr:hypothetical protein [Caballeronia sp. SBC2]QIE22995.1 hypothetical protein SBC2_10080 [Caballeronia sp. SBC2]